MTVETVSSAELVRRLTPLLDAHSDGVVAFDADGTLWEGDVGEDYFLHFLEHASLTNIAERGVATLAQAHGIARGPDPMGTVRAIWSAFQQSRFPEDVLYELVTWCAAGRPRSEVEELARASIAPDLVERLRPELAPVLDWVRARGVEAWVVSASPRFVVEAALVVVDGRVPVASERVVALEPRWDGEVMAADVGRPISYGEGKVTCLRALIGARPLLAAFGDSGFDAPLLGGAKIGVAVRPKPPLLAARIPGLLTLETPPARLESDQGGT